MSTFRVRVVLNRKLKIIREIKRDKIRLIIGIMIIISSIIISPSILIKLENHNSQIIILSNTMVLASAVCPFTFIFLRRNNSQ